LPPRIRLAEIVRELPRRAHGLSRKTVHDSQRWRMLEAVTEATAKVGYAAATVADVIARAGVSRKAFYEQFTDKEDCFLTAYDVVSERLIATLVAVGADHAHEGARRRAQVEAFLAALAKSPAAARVFMVDVLAAGPRALRRREQVNRSFADAVFGDAPVDDVRRAAIVGGVNNVVTSALLDPRAPPLEGLTQPLAAFVQSALGLPGAPAKPRRAR
jgi:AcrR family transcriptional regulator